MIRSGDLVIIDEFDRPCDRLVVWVDRVEDGTVHGHYSDGMPVRGPVARATSVRDFGRRVYPAAGGAWRTIRDLSLKQTASYADGLPRLWQPEAGGTP